MKKIKERKMKMKKERKTRAEEGDDDESGEGGKEREKERKKEATGKDENTNMVPQHLCSCANHSRDHNRLSDSLVGVSRRLERDRKKCLHVSWSSQAVLEMASFGAHARQASADEPSGARLFSGFGVES